MAEVFNLTENILYEDNHLIVVFKPAGLLVQGDESGDSNLMDIVKAYLKEKYKKPGSVFLGLVHRLDRPVSGIVLYAKTSKGASRISEQFRDRTVRKEYQAVLVGRIEPPSGTLKHKLEKDEKKRTAEVSEEGDEAELSYETIGANENYSHVKIELKTGRFHQIRAQFAAAGHPIAGDVKYGAKEKTPDGSIALCATGLTFRTATGDEEKTIVVQHPQEWCHWFDMFA